MFEIVRYTADRAEAWNAFVAESKNGTFLFDRGYMDYHADRFSDYSLMFYVGDRLLAVLPAHAVGDTLCSHRGLTYGGLLMSVRLTIAETMTLFRELNDMLRTSGFRHVSYKAIPWIYHRLSAEEDLYALYHECKARIVARDYSTNIFLGAGLRWERVRRRGVVRAEQAGIHVEISDNQIQRIQDGNCIELRRCFRIQHRKTSKVRRANVGNRIHDNVVDGRIRVFIRKDDPTSSLYRNKRVSP